MKLRMLCLLCLLLILLLTACSTPASQAGEKDDPTPDTHEEANADQMAADTSEQVLNVFLDPSLFPNLIEETPNYKLYSNEEKRGYYYEIYDNTGSELDYGYCTWRSDGVEAVNDTLLMVRERSGGAMFSAKYFDVENGRVSRVFSKPAGVSDSYLIAYFETDDIGIKLIVRDLFDPNGFYKEILDESFDIPVYTVECTAQFSPDDSSVTLTYMDNNRETVTKTFATGKERYDEGKNARTELGYEVVSKDYAHSNGSFQISYPVILRDAKAYGKANALIEQALASRLTALAEDGFSVQMGYTTTYNSENLICFLFEGNMYHKDAAHPSNMGFSICISLKNQEIVEPSVFFEVDDAFIEAFRFGAQQRDDNRFTEDQWAQIVEFLEEYSDKNVRDNLQADSAEFALAPGEIIVLFPVPHAIGDYLKIPLTYDWETK